MKAEIKQVSLHVTMKNGSTWILKPAGDLDGCFLWPETLKYADAVHFALYGDVPPRFGPVVLRLASGKLMKPDEVHVIPAQKTIRESKLLEPQEIEALDHLAGFLRIVQTFTPEGKEQPNLDELVGAIHVLQTFITQRVMHRLEPEIWSNWYV